MNANGLLLRGILGATLIAAGTYGARADQWGDFKDRFVYDGLPPTPAKINVNRDLVTFGNLGESIEENRSAAGIVRRAETTPLRRTDGTIVPRVETDQDGNVVRLLLNDMRLSAMDVDELGTLVHLRSLVLYHTDFADKDVSQLHRCANLEHLNLSGTKVTDAAVEPILGLRKLSSLCLGNVDISAAAVSKLNSGFQSRGQVVRMGYSRAAQ